MSPRGSIIEKKDNYGVLVEDQEAKLRGVKGKKKGTAILHSGRTLKSLYYRPLTALVDMNVEVISDKNKEQYDMGMMIDLRKLTRRGLKPYLLTELSLKIEFCKATVFY